MVIRWARVKSGTWRIKQFNASLKNPLHFRKLAQSLAAPKNKNHLLAEHSKVPAPPPSRAELDPPAND
jgi:hypothetical protein